MARTRGSFLKLLSSTPLEHAASESFDYSCSAQPERVRGSIQKCLLSTPAAAAQLSTQTQPPQISSKLKVGFRGDSILHFRTTAKSSKSNRTKTCQEHLESVFRPVFGPCDIDHEAWAGAKIADITKSILEGPNFDFFCIALGVNDLCNGSGVLASYPHSLDSRLVALAEAAMGKAEVCLTLIGGPADMWAYPARWNDFIQHAHEVMQSAGMPVVPMHEAARVLRRMPLQDGLHFANDEDSKQCFAEAWARWLCEHAGARSEQTSLRDATWQLSEEDEEQGREQEQDQEQEREEMLRSLRVLRQRQSQPGLAVGRDRSRSPRSSGEARRSSFSCA